MVVVAAPRVAAQGRGALGGGGRDLVALDFSKLPIGAPPADVRVLRGKFEVVNKDGTRMLRCSEDGAFLVSVPEKIPNRFVLEFDLVPKFSGETSTTELSFEGTREVSHSDESAHIMWSHNKVSVIGGGQTYAGGQIDLPEDLKEEVIGNLTKIRAEFDGSNVTVLTNGRTVFESKIAKFNRGRVVRVSLGGTDENENAVYLAGMRMIALDGPGASTAQNQSGLASTRVSGSESFGGGGTGAASNEMTDPAQDTHTASPVPSQAITGITVAVDAAGLATVTWNPLTVAATYQVLRWNAGDPACCNNMSPPGMPLQSAVWQDGVLPVAGTYAYRVIAKTADGFIAGETQISYRGSATPPPGVATSTIPTVDVPTIAPGPVTTASSTYMTPGRLAAIAPPPAESAEDSGVIKFDTPVSSDLPVLDDAPVSGDTSSGTGGTAPPGTIVTAEPAPYSSGPRSVSVMTTEPAPTANEPVTAILAEPTLRFDAATPIAGAVTTEPMKPDANAGDGGGGGASPGDEIQDPGQGSGGGGQPGSGRYRVVIAGFTVAKEQNDDPLNIDGHGNEVYAAAAVVNWNRSASQLTSFSTVQTLDYGDVGTGGRFGDRIRAGTGSMNGGIVAGNRVPAEYDVTGGSLPAAASDRFPLHVWEGTLTAGVEAIVVCPSIWERDSVRAQFDIYKGNWSKASPSGLMGSASIANKSSSSSLESVLAPIAPSVAIAPPAPTFTGSPSDGYKIAGLTFGPGVDRPIGMGLPVIAVLTYQDRFIVVTQENAGSLPVGGGVTLALPFAEPMDLFLGALYTLYVRIERLE